MHKVLNLFDLSIYFCLTYYGLSFSPSSEAGARARSPDPGDWNHCRSCTPASEDGLKKKPETCKAEVNR
jgi:hypothetical protein